jgi:hypothetical protein
MAAMKKSKQKIKNLDALEKEIYRLRLEAKVTAGKLEENFDRFQQHYGKMAMNSIFNSASAGKEKVKEKIFSSIWENEKVQNGINKIVDHLADKAADGINSLVDKILHRKD